MSTKHTPTPWENKGFAVVNREKRVVIGQLSSSEQDASFIVRAVNSHDELLFCLKHAQAELKGEGVILKSVVLDWIRKAIQQAEG